MLVTLALLLACNRPEPRAHARAPIAPPTANIGGARAAAASGVDVYLSAGRHDSTGNCAPLDGANCELWHVRVDPATGKADVVKRIVPTGNLGGQQAG